MEKKAPTRSRLSLEDLLTMLKLEEAEVATVGYRPYPRAPQLRVEPFRDSITCLAFAREELEPCDNCWLMDFIPSNYHDKALPCHQIPLNEKGETVATIEATGDYERLEKAVLAWLRGRIATLEQELKESRQKDTSLPRTAESGRAITQTHRG